jgi:hypothetical protein
VSSLEGTFPKEKVGTNPKAIFCVVLFHFYVLGRTVRIHTVRTTGRGPRFSRQRSTQKSRHFLEILLLLGHTVQVVQHYVGHVFRGTDLKEIVQLYGLGHIFQGRNFGTVFCGYEVFPLAGNVYLLLYCTFLKLNNISLSLSLGFPTLGFSLTFA